MRECPRCGLVHPPEAPHCVCGCDLSALDRARIHESKARPFAEFYRSYGYFKLLLGVIGLGLFGIFMLIWELFTLPVSIFAVIRSVILAAVGFGFAVFLILDKKKHG